MTIGRPYRRSRKKKNRNTAHAVEDLYTVVTAYTHLTDRCYAKKQKAKGDLADLRKLRKAVNDRKVEVKKEYMKPYEVFEDKVKELIGVIDKPIALIDGQVKEFEAKRVEEKKAEIQNLYNELVEEELHDYIPLEKIYGEKWTNASTTM